jgi:YegS/Rv2252/BmrU family lipid kinase
MKQRRALLIINAKSRSGAESRSAAMDALAAGGIDLVEGGCNRRDEVGPCIRAHAADVDRVVLAGGDGTLNSAAAALAETGLPLGILPTGTANDLARTLSIPSDLKLAADVIAAGQTRKIDLGVVNDQPFFNAASIGLSVELTRQLNRDIKRYFGRLSYAVAAVRVLARVHPFYAMITAEGGTARVHTLQIAVGNGRYYGGGTVIERDASIDDQRLDLYSLEFRRAWKLALLARDLRHGEHGAWREVRTIRARNFEVSTRRPKPVNVDGEIVTQTPARFSVRPAALSVFVPKDDPVPSQPARQPD